MSFELEQSESGEIIIGRFGRNISLAAVEGKSLAATKEQYLLCQSFPSKGRLAWIQLRHPLDDWDIIAHDYEVVSVLSRDLSLANEIAFVNLPTDFYEARYTRERIPVGLFDELERLAHLVNIEGWAIYSHWINEEFRSRFANIALTQTDQYTLQAHLEEFDHEHTSTLFLKRLEELRKLALEITLSPKGSTEERMMELRGEIRENLLSHVKILEGMKEALLSIWDDYPFLNDLVEIVVLFIELLRLQIGLGKKDEASWFRIILLLSRLNQLLGVQAIYHCELQSERAPITQAAYHALDALNFSRENPDFLIQLLNEWEEICTRLDKIKGGISAFADSREEAVFRIQSSFWKGLNAWPKREGWEIRTEVALNPDFAALFP